MNINPKSYYIVDLTHIYLPRILRNEFSSKFDAKVTLLTKYSGDYNYAIIVKGKKAIKHNLRFKNPKDNNSTIKVGGNIIYPDFAKTAKDRKRYRRVRRYHLKKHIYESDHNPRTHTGKIRERARWFYQLYSG